MYSVDMYGLYRSVDFHGRHSIQDPSYQDSLPKDQNQVDLLPSSYEQSLYLMDLRR